MGEQLAFSRGDNYYLNARREWSERYGEFIHAAAIWRRVAFASLGVSAISVGVSGYLSLRSHYVPYVIELGRDGTPTVAGFAGRASIKDERVIKAVLSSFITDLRSVVTDGDAERGAIKRLFHFIRVADPAHQMLIEHFRNPDNDPFERAKKETALIQVTSVLPVTKDTWQIEWIETVRARNGTEREKMAMKAMTTLELIEPQTEELILHNPIGLFVKDLRWSKSL